MARTVSTGYRTVTPGECGECGSDSDYGCDGRGTVLCSCSPDFDESYDTTEAGESQTHWGYGSGMPGCLFDNGPHFAETQHDAINAVLCYFSETGNESDLSEAELAQARADLLECGTHYFPAERRGELGASMVQVWEEQGPCPESDE